MFCTKCGKEIKDSSTFCRWCGSPTGIGAPVEKNVPSAGPKKILQTKKGLHC